MGGLRVPSEAVPHFMAVGDAPTVSALRQALELASEARLRGDAGGAAMLEGFAAGLVRAALAAARRVVGQ